SSPSGSSSSRASAPAERKIAAITSTVGGHTARTLARNRNAAFVCECSDEACTERVDASLGDYERARENGAHFLMHRGHEDTRVERVVEVRGRLAIVEKFNHAIARAVRRLDPRSEPV